MGTDEKRLADPGRESEPSVTHPEARPEGDASDAATALRESRQFLHDVFETIQDGISVLDANLTIQHVNHKMNEWYTANAPLEGRRCFEAYHNQSKPCDPCPTLRCIATGQTEREEIRGLPGSVVEFLELFSYPMKDGNGKVVAVVEFVRDITKRKSAERALHASQAKLNSIFRAAPVGIGLMRDRVFLEVNDTVCRMTGYTREELIGQSTRILYASDEDYAYVGQEKYEQIAANGAASVETRWRHKDGAILHIILSSTPLDPSNLDAGVTFTALDITERKHAEEEQQRLEQQIQQTQKLESLGVLAGGIAHDFNNILMALLGHAELAMDELGPLSPARENIEEIGAAARRAADLCRQMLAYAGRAAFTLETINVSELIDEMAFLLKTSVSKKCILNMHLARDLPCIKADPSQIRQIIMNLVINASEAIGERSGVITVTTGATRCDEEYLRKTELHGDLPPGMYVHIEVADTGCGMDAVTRQRLFEPFFTTKFTGRGLGMAAALGIVRAHHGAVKVYSEPGKGTTFKILFPAMDVEEENVQKPSTLYAGWRGVGTVLLVDDEESLRAVGARLLERLGFVVLTAEDGRKAVDIYQSQGTAIDLVLLDLTMPHMNGEEAYRALRQLNPEVRVIMASGYSQEDVSARFAGKGLAGVLQKPYTFAKLREMLAQIF